MAQSASLTLPPGHRRLGWSLNAGDISQALLFLAVALLVLYPVSWLIRGSFWTTRPGVAGNFTLANYADTLSDGRTWGLLASSVAISLGQTLLACAIGTGLALLVVRTDMPAKAFAELTAPLPFFVPGIVTSMGWAILANPSNGLLNKAAGAVLPFGQSLFNVYTPLGIVTVMALTSAGFVYLLMLGPIRNLDPGLEESARMSGAGGAQVLRRVTLPLLLPGISGAGILTFLAGLESFEVPAILGTPGKVFVFTNEIYYHLHSENPANYGAAMTLAVLLAVIMLVVITGVWRLIGNRSYTTISGRGYRSHVIALGRWRAAAAAAFGLYLLVAAVLPLGLMIASSFFRVFGFYSLATLTFENYTALLAQSEFGRALVNSLLVSIGGGLVTMLISAGVAYVATRTRFRLRRLLEMVVWLPWGLPGLVLSLAMLWAYIRLPIPIYGTLWVLLLAYVTFGLSLGVRSMSGVLLQISPDLEESARVSGASWARAFREIVYALARPAFIAGWFLLGFLYIRVLSVPLMLYSRGSEVLSVESLSAWELGHGAQAAAIGTIMLALMVLFMGIERLVRSREGRTQVAASGLAVAAPV